MNDNEKIYTTKDVLEILRQCLFFGEPEYWEQGGINKNIKPTNTYKKAQDYFERFYLKKQPLTNPNIPHSPK
jgi:hypothetical protein